MIKVEQQLCTKKTPFDVNNAQFNLIADVVNKPVQAFWTSTAYLRDAEWCSSWLEWTSQNLMEFSNVINYIYLISPKDTAKVYEIKNINDYLCLPKHIIPLGNQSTVEVLDFQAINDRGFDGIHLTNLALQDTSLMDMDIEKDNDNGRLTFWDIESTVWFNIQWIEKIDCIWQRQ